MPTSTTATHHSPGTILWFPRKGGGPAPYHRRRTLYAIPMLMLLGLVLTGIVIAIVQKEESIRELPPSVRAHIFQQTMAELRSTCVEPYASRGPVRDHCVEQARFIVRFPGCGPACRIATDPVFRGRTGRAQDPRLYFH